MKEQVDCNSQRSLKRDIVEADAHEVQPTLVQSQDLAEELCEKPCDSELSDVLVEIKQEVKIEGSAK